VKSVARYLRANALAAVALFVALGGTGYAAFGVPRNSVGTRQLQNGAVTPAKLDRGLITGSVRAWAIVSPTGKVLAGGGKPRASVVGSGGFYGIDWGVPIPKNCATVANVEQRAASGPTETIPTPNGGPLNVVAGYVTQVETIGGSDRSRATTPSTTVYTLNQSGQLAALPFDVAVIC
jgi:hypothetical protein